MSELEMRRSYEAEGMSESEIEAQLDMNEAQPEDDPEDDDMAGWNIRMEQIGTVESGIDGSDQYLLLTRKDGDLTPEQAQDWVLPKVYRESSQPGGYFCSSVRAVQVQYSSNRVICTVEHRYDI